MQEFPCFDGVSSTAGQEFQSVVASPQTTVEKKVYLTKISAQGKFALAHYE